MNNKGPTRVLILGGGFAGLYTAIRLKKTLARDPDIEVTLVNRENFFLFTPMLHEVAASDLDLTTIVNPARKMLKRVNFFAGELNRSTWPVSKSSFPTASIIITTRWNMTTWSWVWARSSIFITCPVLNSGP